MNTSLRLLRTTNRNQPLVILVLGVGGNVSQGILKALALSQLAYRVIGACVSPLAMGLYTVDQAYLSPAANEPDFLPWLIELCRREQVDVVLSGVEPVLAVLAKEQQLLMAETGAVILVSSAEQFAMAQDKLLTCQWLLSHGLAAPRTVDASDADGIAALAAEGQVLLAKPRRGRGGQGILKLVSAADLQYIQTKADYVVQEYLPDDHAEYTAACLSDKQGQVKGCIVLRRDLLEGTTYRAEAGAFPAVTAEAERIARALRPMGPCNMQFRLRDGQPVCFEINLRFSGTTPIRAQLGFNDVAAALRHYVLGEAMAELPKITSGIALRYWNELYLDPAAVAAFRPDGSLPQPRQYCHKVEKFGTLS